MKQRKISDFIADMVQSDDEASKTNNKRTEKLAEKLMPKMMAKAASHEARIYQARDSTVSQLSHVMETTSITGGRRRFSSSFGE